jgi:hypothetical protein
MSPTDKTGRINSYVKMPRCLAGCLLGISILFTSNVQCADPAAGKSRDVAALIEQLGVDTASDAAAMGKLRAMIAQDQPMSAAAASDDIQEGLWSGVVERVYVDNLDAQGNLVPGPTQFYLQTGTEHLQVFFLDKATEPVESGQQMEIRGYRTGRRALVLEAGRKRQDSHRSGRPKRSNKP